VHAHSCVTTINDYVPTSGVNRAVNSGQGGKMGHSVTVNEINDIKVDLHCTTGQKRKDKYAFIFIDEYILPRRCNARQPGKRDESA